MITVEGKCGIKATVLAHSISQAGVELITYELEYPRLILAELNTHRMLSRNSFSSRAVPFEKMIQQLSGRPVRFGANQAGMQDKGEDYNAPVRGTWGEAPVSPEMAWEDYRDQSIRAAKAFKEAGYHKQVYNRLLEPFQMMKTVISGTEWSNFWWLRDDEAADPTIAELARCMREAKEASTPNELKPGQWHLPYMDWMMDDDGEQVFFLKKGESYNDGITIITLDQALKISCARCAAVSYRNEGYGLEKSVELYDRLVGSDKKHASALEHCATPMKEMEFQVEYEVNVPTDPSTWEEGISHMDKKGNLWSGNFRGFIQHRKTIKGENYEGQEVA